MHLLYEMLASAREAELERGLHMRRLAAAAARCREWLLGVIPVLRPCEA